MRSTWQWACPVLGLCAVTGAQEPPGDPGADEIAELRRRIELLERLAGEAGEVDLTESENTEYRPQELQHILARPWYESFHISGFAAFDYLQTGDAARRPDGGFAVRETALWVEADIWDEISVFLEIRTDYKAFNSFNVTTGEVYGHLRNVFGGEDVLSLKVGRFDVPFSEEYLYEHPPDNPLILNSAHWWYATDEGILLYGKLGDLGWIGSVTNGSSARNIDDDAAKAVTLKAYGNPTEQLYLSGSLLRNGRTTRSGLRFGGSNFEPVGQNGTSTVGASPSTEIEAWAYALDGRYSFSDQAYILASFGQAWVDDKVSVFDRDFLWWSVEALYNITDNVYVAGRYSSIGTHDSNDGYHFDGTFTAGGNQAFGYDTREFQRLQLGLGWTPVPRVLLKVEGGYDRFRMIDASPLDPNNDERWFFGAELVLSF